MATFDDITSAQARVARLQAALNDELTGSLRLGLDATTAAGSNRINFFKPEVS